MRGLGVSLLILGLGHTPLPKADYHNIRHHDGPGQVCRLHEHLLRWHPEAQRADDVAVLHWHWFLPTSQGPDSTTGDEHPVLHPSHPDWLGLTWDDAPQLAPQGAARFLGRPPLGPPSGLLPRPDADLAGLLARAGPDPGSRASLRRVQSFGATFAPGASLPSLLSRWTC